MDKWNLIIDVAKCMNCHNCVLAVKDEHCDNDFPGYAASQPRHGQHWIKIARTVRGVAPMVDVAYLPTTCNHCDNAPCVEAGKGAVSKRGDGIVIIDPQKTKGRKDLLKSCPYGAIWWNEELQIPQKWIFEAHLLDNGWKVPRCAQACPTGAMSASKVSDEAMTERARREKLEVLRPELGTKPRVWYRNLARCTKAFIGGSVVGKLDGSRECLAGARVSLLRAQKTVAETQTDDFGDFRFDNLDPRSGSYAVEIAHAGFGKRQIPVELDDSACLGVIDLES